MSFVDAGPIKFGERVGPRRCGSDERSPMKHQRLVRGAVGGVLHRHQHRGQVRARVVVAVLRRTIPRPAGFGNRGQAGPARRARPLPRPAHTGQPGMPGKWGAPVRTSLPAPPGWHLVGPDAYRRTQRPRQPHRPGPRAPPARRWAKTRLGRAEWYRRHRTAGMPAQASRGQSRQTPNPLTLPVPARWLCDTCRACRIVARTCR